MLKLFIKKKKRHGNLGKSVLEITSDGEDLNM